MSNGEDRGNFQRVRIKAVAMFRVFTEHYLDHRHDLGSYESFTAIKAMANLVNTLLHLPCSNAS